MAGKRAGRAVGDNCNAASHWSTHAIRWRADKKKTGPSRVWRLFVWDCLENGFRFQTSEVKKKEVECSEEKAATQTVEMG